jgi:hypothetical protein
MNDETKLLPILILKKSVEKILSGKELSALLRSASDKCPYPGVKSYLNELSYQVHYIIPMAIFSTSYFLTLTSVLRAELAT